MSYTMKNVDWRRMFDSVLDPFFVHDKDFRIMLANRAYFESAGISEEEAIGKLYWEVFPKGSGPMKSCLNAMDGECNKEDEQEEIHLPDGRVFLSRSACFTDEGGVIVTAVII